MLVTCRFNIIYLFRMRDDILAMAIAVILVQVIVSSQATVIIPTTGRTIEGDKLTFTCINEGEGNSTYSLWKTSIVQAYFVLAVNGTDGQCMTENLPNGLYPYCSVNMFKLTISPVANSMHDSRWICSQMFMDSNASNIFVEVPVKNVSMGLINGETKGEIACVENEILVMECNASFGRPQPNISWYIGHSYTNASEVVSTTSTLLNDNSIDNSYTNTVGVLTLKVSRSYYRKLLFCNSTNLQTEHPVSSNFALLNVQYPPEIVGEIQNIFVIESKAVSISYKVIQGNPSETTFTWKREVDNTIWRNESLLLDGVSRKDAGVYTFMASNTMTFSNGSDVQGYISKVMYLEVLYPPEEMSVACSTDNSWNISIVEMFDITEGTNLTLTCSADSVPPPSSYSWSGLITAATANLTLFVSKHHSGDLICTANNTMKETHGNITTGTKSKLYHMNVLYAPEVTIMQNITAIEGEYFVYNCSVIFGNPSETTFRWIRNDDNITWHSQTLSVNNISRYDSHTYTCSASNVLRPTYGENTIGFSSQGVNIDVLYKANIQYFVIDGHSTNNNVTVNESDSLPFICGVDSNPGSFMELSFEENSLLQINGTHELIYQINHAKCTDLGRYRCYGHNWLNSLHNIPHADITLYVNCAPRQSSTFYPAENVTNVTSVRHVSCTFTFNALAYPLPSAHWYKKYNNDSWMLLDETNSKITMSSSEAKLQYTLTILNISEFDYGQYRLSITNSFGQHIQLFNLIPLDLQDIPSRFSIYEDTITETSVTFWWVPGFDGGLHQTFIIGIRTEDMSTNYTSIKDTNEPVMNSTVFGLNSGTKYYFSIYASNEKGSVRFPDEIYITTKVPQETANTFAIVWPAVGGAVGGVLVIAMIVAVVTLIRKRQGSRMPEIPNNHNTTNFSTDDDYAVPFDGGCSNVYETLQTRGCDPQYQHLSTFAGAGIQNKDKHYENLRLQSNIEDLRGGGLARHRQPSLPETKRHNETLF